VEKGGLVGAGALVVEEGEVKGCGCKGEAGEEGGGEAHCLGGGGNEGGNDLVELNFEYDCESR